MNKLRQPSEVILKNGKTLEEVLKLHNMWLNNEEGGEKANLSETNLSEVNLSGANLSEVNLSCAYLNHTDLSEADLSEVNLSRADLRYANLSGADLSGANLSRAKLSRAKLKGVKSNNSTAFFLLQCPEEGSFIAYKKAKKDEEDVIVKMLVSEDSKRSSATSRKCRFSKIKVLSITSLDGNKEYQECYSSRDKNFIYKVEKIIEISDFNENRWEECSTGIHGLLTRQEAVEYNI